MKLAIVTGASRGLGRAIAEELLNRNYEVVNFSRTQATDATFRHVEVDLSDPTSTLHALEHVKPLLETATSLLVVQNAALIEPIHRAGQLDAAQLIAHVQANLLAPMLLTNAVLALSLIHISEPTRRS